MCKPAEDSGFYNGNELLSKKDINGLEPEIFLLVGNRTAGKSFFLKRLMIRKFLKGHGKFALLVRFVNELDNAHEMFFKDLQEVCYYDKEMTSVERADGLFREFYLDGEPCGYAIALNSSDSLKKHSATFVDVERIFFDEFQSEVGKYCAKELDKFQSIHVTIARGGGKHVRHVPVYMASNQATVLNPYYTALGIGSRLRTNTRFLRGDGWVLEQTYNENASKAISSSGFGRAFAASSYMGFATDNKYLLDNDNFIEQVKGHGLQIATISDRGSNFGIWDMRDAGVIAIRRACNPTHPIKLTFRVKEHQVSHNMVRPNNPLVKNLKVKFESGHVRFDDMQCRETFIEFIGYALLD